MTYAGRLDPMASGLLLILAGDETKNKEKYLNLGKEYKFEVLFGFNTDTYDILGKVTTNFEFSATDYKLKELETKIKKELKNFTGKFKQKYPIFSSKTVKGKPLFFYARHGENIEVPDREINVKSIKFIKLRKINNEKLLENIECRIKKVQGDFRQKEILEIWRKKLKQGQSLLKKEEYFYIANLEIKCGTGTYVRGIVNSLSENIRIPALAYSIKRTKIGKYVL